jgi:hypothetical protein
VHQVIVLELRTVEKVADDARVRGYLDIDGIFDCPHRGQSMRVRSDPAGALHEMVRIARIASLENQLDSSKHLSRTPGIFYLTTFNLHFDAKVAFNPGNRINYDSLRHKISSLC